MLADEMHGFVFICEHLRNLRLKKLLRVYSVLSVISVVNRICFLRVFVPSW
jgi:hypothetical protein